MFPEHVGAAESDSFVNINIEQSDRYGRTQNIRHSVALRIPP